MFSGGNDNLAVLNAINDLQQACHKLVRMGARIREVRVTEAERPIARIRISNPVRGLALDSQIIHRTNLQATFAAPLGAVQVEWVTQIQRG